MGLYGKLFYFILFFIIYNLTKIHVTGTEKDCEKLTVFKSIEKCDGNDSENQEITVNLSIKYPTVRVLL